MAAEEGMSEASGAPARTIGLIYVWWQADWSTPRRSPSRLPILPCSPCFPKSDKAEVTHHRLLPTWEQAG